MKGGEGEGVGALELPRRTRSTPHWRPPQRIIANGGGPPDPHLPLHILVDELQSGSRQAGSAEQQGTTSRAAASVGRGEAAASRRRRARPLTRTSGPRAMNLSATCASCQAKGEGVSMRGSKGRPPASAADGRARTRKAERSVGPHGSSRPAAHLLLRLPVARQHHEAKGAAVEVLDLQRGAAARARQARVWRRVPHPDAAGGGGRRAAANCSGSHPAVSLPASPSRSGGPSPAAPRPPLALLREPLLPGRSCSAP